jgi:hypothetical protein
VRDPEQWGAFRETLAAEEEDDMTQEKFGEMLREALTGPEAQEKFNGMYKAMIAEKHGDGRDKYADEATEAAKAAGVFAGDGEGNYEWRDPVTRQDLALILSRLGLLGAKSGQLLREAAGQAVTLLRLLAALERQPEA